MTFLTKLESNLPRWAKSHIRNVLTMLELTSNRIELEFAIMRGKQKQNVAGLNKKNETPDVVTFSSRVLATRDHKT